MQEKIKIGEVDHICVLVDDIGRALEKMSRVFDIPPAKIEEYTSTARLSGKEVGKYKLKLVMIQLARNLVLELLQIVEGKSVELEWLRRHGQTTHHIALKVEDMEKEAAKWERKGIKILQEDHGKWIYLDTEDLLGINIELVPR